MIKRENNPNGKKLLKSEDKNMFHVVSDKFFVPLASPNKQIYWECISRLFSIMNHQLSFGIERDVLVEELQYYFEQEHAIEIEADAMLLAKAIDGIYDSDPKLNPESKKYDEISIQEVIDQKLAAVDMTASILCMENKMPMLVFGLNEENSIVETMSGTFTGTKVTV